MSPELLRSMRVDRQIEIERILHSLAEQSHNVLLYGARGSGKTFITRIVEDEIREKYDKLVVSRFNVYSSFVGSIDTLGDPSKLPGFVLVQLCVDIWKNVLGRNYLELRELLLANRHSIIASKPEHTVANIYRLLMHQEVEFLNEKDGGSVIANVELNEGESARLKGVPMQPFEFSEFIDLLMRDVLLPIGLTRIVIILDEANKLSIYMQEEMLSRFLEIFSSRNIQFLFVAGGIDFDKNPIVPSCFESTLELFGLSEAAHIHELIDHRLRQLDRSAFSFSPEAIEVLFQTYCGHPRKTLEACDFAYKRALASNKSFVDLGLILEASRYLDEAERKMRELADPSSRIRM